MEWLQHLLEDSALKNKLRVLPLLSVLVLVLILALQAPPSRAQSESSLSQRIQKVISRPEFAHANFGIEFYSLDSGKVVYALNADKLFVPASTTKILTEGTPLAKGAQTSSCPPSWSMTMSSILVARQVRRRATPSLSNSRLRLPTSNS